MKKIIQVLIRCSEEITDNKRKSLIRAHRVIFQAFNGAKFDNNFIFKSKRIQFKEIIESFGLLQMSLKDGYIEFRDPLRMTGTATLAGLCKYYNIPPEFSKDEFPHKFDYAEHLDYVGAVPPAEFWESEQVPDDFNDPAYIYDFRQKSNHYQKLECVSLAIIWHKLSKELYGITNLRTIDFLTAPYLAYKFLMENVPPHGVKVCSDRYVDAWMRKSIQGGRCFVQKGYFKYVDADNFEKHLSNELFEKCEDYLCDFDASSLYPSAMSMFEYPVGQPYWEQYVDAVRDALNSQNHDFPLGIVECEVSFPDITGQIFPLLSHKSHDGRLLYTFQTEPYKIIIKTTIDIMEAVKYNGVVVVQVFNALLFPKRLPIFHDAITTLFNLKL